MDKNDQQKSSAATYPRDEQGLRVQIEATSPGENLKGK